MAVELNKRTKILAGVVVLAAAGAAAWFFFLQDFLDEPPPRPVAAGAEKAAAAKPAAEPAKQADAPKPAATAAAPAAKPAAKPIPSNPDQAVAEFLEASGAKAQLQQVARDVTRGAQLKDPAAAKEFAAILERVFEPNAMLAEVTANLKQSYDAGRMSRYLEHLRQPIVVKINAMGAEARGVPAEAMKAQMDEMDKNPPSAERAKLLARSEELDRMRGLGTEIGAVMGRGYAEGVLEYLHSSRSGNAALTQIGKGNPRNARAALLSQVTHNQGERIKAAVTRRAVAYRGASDAELAEYLKAIDTEIGEWGATTLAGALKPVFEKRGHEQGRTFAQFAFGGKRVAASTTAPAPAEKPAVAASASKPAADTPVSKPAAATPPEPVGYQRAANIRPLYTRYNDLMSATVMRDRAAVKELLDDGKYPNVRQKDGSTPLMVAVSNGDAAIASMLLAKGADPNLRAAGGVSALSLARARGAAGNEMVQLLQRSGAKD